MITDARGAGAVEDFLSTYRGQNRISTWYTAHCVVEGGWHSHSGRAFQTLKEAKKAAQAEHCPGLPAAVMIHRKTESERGVMV